MCGGVVLNWFTSNVHVEVLKVFYFLFTQMSCTTKKIN